MKKYWMFIVLATLFLACSSPSNDKKPEEKKSLQELSNTGKTVEKMDVSVIALSQRWNIPQDEAYNTISDCLKSYNQPVNASTLRDVEILLEKYSGYSFSGKNILEKATTSAGEENESLENGIIKAIEELKKGK